MKILILDYKKIRDICLLDKLLILCMCSTMFMEPIIMHYCFQNSEFSFHKMIIRSILLINVINTLKKITTTTLGPRPAEAGHPLKGVQIDQ